MCPRVFVNFLCKRDAKIKTCECKKNYAATVQSTWGLKECKSRKYFYDLFQCKYREINMLI
jgi:hypothetical protein